MRPKILELGVDSWAEKHIEAAKIINRDLKAWYSKAAEERDIDSELIPFEPDKLLNAKDELCRLSCFKALELVYDHLTKDMAEDPFAIQRDYFSKKYAEELSIIMETGLDYDWDSSGGIELLEKENPKPRLRQIERFP